MGSAIIGQKNVVVHFFLFFSSCLICNYGVVPITLNTFSDFEKGDYVFDVCLVACQLKSTQFSWQCCSAAIPIWLAN